jgi:hypothetical protein
MRSSTCRLGEKTNPSCVPPTLAEKRGSKCKIKKNKKWKMESEDRMAGSRELTHQRFFQIIKKM